MRERWFGRAVPDRTFSIRDFRVFDGSLIYRPGRVLMPEPVIRGNQIGAGFKGFETKDTILVSAARLKRIILGLKMDCYQSVRDPSGTVMVMRGGDEKVARLSDGDVKSVTPQGKDRQPQGQNKQQIS
jgi:hypothetical protein